MQYCKEELNVKGKYINVDAVKLNNKVLIVTGKLIKTAKIKNEWYEDIENPLEISCALKKSNLKADLFTFWERFPKNNLKYDYYLEWEPTSILSLKSYDHWWNKQVIPAVRTKVRKAKKKGVVVKKVEFNDDLLIQIIEIFNETPVRQNKPFWHFKRNFEFVKKDLARDLGRSDFIGAYYNDKLIGFIKLIYTEKVADPVQCISMIRYKNKSPTNVLISEMVKICDRKNIPYIAYGAWRSGSHGKFLGANGFERKLFPRYYIPLTIKGKIVLKLKLHKGILELLPDKTIEWLKNLRTKFYTMKYKIV